MDDLARRSPDDRAAVFRRAAADRGLPSQHVEKDFWVCWVLRRVFSPPLVDGMVFKGGTSLSKVWNAIERFSEDVDLTVPRHRVPGATESTLSESASITQRKKWSDEQRGVLQEWVEGAGHAEIETRMRDALGTYEGWRLNARGDAIAFEYPAGLPSSAFAGSYVRPQVRLEFGLLMPVEPWEEHAVRPYADRAGNYSMPDPGVLLRTLAGERTFWEKATLVHAENNRPEVRVETDRLSRHYADLASLRTHEIGARALERIELLPQVAREKEMHYYAAWADYPAAACGKLRLVPPPEHEKALRRGYGGMREMYFGEILPFDTILERLRELQDVVEQHSFFRG